MPRNRPPTSGYTRIIQAEEEEDPLTISDDDGGQLKYSRTVSATQYAPIQPKRRGERMHALGATSPRRSGRRRRTNSNVDIKAINARLEKWADEIAQKFKIRKVQGKTIEEEQLEIHHSVFQAPDWIRPATAETLTSEYDNSDVADRLSKLEYDDVVESVRTAIELGMHPKLIAKGSSGSYFVRNSSGKIVGIFKPKDEEPYASKNPKWTKWLHRNLLPFAFGRACLIPNLSYISEAAAYVLDSQLRTNLVPPTEVVSLSSKSFHYDFWERRAFYRKKKSLPQKQGSFQIFLKGYKDTTQFLKEHPWPDRHNVPFHSEATPERKRKRRWAEDCRPKSAPAEDSEDDEESGLTSSEQIRTRQEFWSDELQQSFREQLEKLVILDYIMRNTDRGLDNWMIRIDPEKQEASMVVKPPSRDGQINGHASPTKLNGSDEDPYKRNEPMTAEAPSHGRVSASARIGAIDNSLSWPWKHPDAWRSFPFGWLFLPVTLIGRPFSDATRKHFLPLLTSKKWWSDTQLALRNCFEQDSDFQERMYARQIAVMKGQAWNVVEALKTPDHGPLELTRRARVCVWNDLVDIPVAVPLRPPSEEMKRNAIRNVAKPRHEGIEEEEEMDISAMASSVPQANHDLLGLASPSKVALANPFNLSRQSSANDVNQSADSDLSQLSPPAVSALAVDEVPAPRLTPRAASRPEYLRSKTRISYEEPRRHGVNSPTDRRRRFSFGMRRGSSLSEDDGLEEDGDLGYAAAEGQEGNRRKVIVERLETVKTKAPFFTWC